MPNQTGGKNYKKKKKVTESENVVSIDRQADQLVARVIKVLGNCNLQCYCNDDNIRICHIRGGLQKKVWMNVGDILLISLRDDSGAEKGAERADIIAKYDPRLLTKLKREEGINPKLFLQLENSTGDSLEKLKSQNINANMDIEFDADVDENAESEESSDVDIERI